MKIKNKKTFCIMFKFFYVFYIFIRKSLNIQERMERYNYTVSFYF